MTIEDHADLEEFLDSYIETALWAENDNSDESGGEPFDKNYDSNDIAGEALAKMREECNAFLVKADDLLKQLDKLWESGEWTPRGRQDFTIVSQAAHDFWLTRGGMEPGSGMEIGQSLKPVH